MLESSAVSFDDILEPFNAGFLGSNLFGGFKEEIKSISRVKGVSGTLVPIVAGSFSVSFEVADVPMDRAVGRVGYVLADDICSVGFKLFAVPEPPLSGDSDSE